MRFKSKVIKGRGIGSKIGSPTINLSLEGLDLKFSYGVYICKVWVRNSLYFGALFFGPRETFSESEPSLEIFLIDFSGNLYGSDVEVEVLDKIREIKRFKSIKKLEEQIKEDIKKVKIYSE